MACTKDENLPPYKVTCECLGTYLSKEFIATLPSSNQQAHQYSVWNDVLIKVKIHVCWLHGVCLLGE